MLNSPPFTGLRASDVWVLDSGCSQHMTPHATDLTECMHGNQAVAGVNPNAPIRAIAVGTAIIRPQNCNTQSQAIRAGRTLLVPSLPVRLFSVMRALENQCSLALHHPKPDGFCGTLTIHNGTRIMLYKCEGVIVFRVQTAKQTAAYPAVPQTDANPASLELSFEPETPAQKPEKRAVPRTYAEALRTPQPVQSPPRETGKTHASLPHARLLFHLQTAHRGT